MRKPRCIQFSCFKAAGFRGALHAWAKDTLTAAGFEVVADVLPGDPEAVIAREVKARNIDMLLMGAYAHSPLRALIFGSKTTDLLRAATIPTLLLR